MGKESKRAHSIGNTDDNDTFLRKVGAVIEGHRGGAYGETAAVNPNHHGEMLVRRFRGSPYVEIKTIFADGKPFKAKRRHHDRNLHAARSEFVGDSYPRPLGGRFGSAPAQIPQGRRGKWNSLVNGQAIFYGPLNEACLRRDRGGKLSESCYCQAQSGDKG